MVCGNRLESCRGRTAEVHMADEEKIKVAVPQAREFSSLERKVLLVGGIVALVLLVLHFPFEGYNTECNVDSFDALEVCFKRRIADGSDEAPFWYWRSIGALVPQLAPLKLLLVWEGFVVLVAAAVILLFRGKGEAKPQP